MNQSNLAEFFPQGVKAEPTESAVTGKTRGKSGQGTKIAEPVQAEAVGEPPRKRGKCAGGKTT